MTAVYWLGAPGVSSIEYPPGSGVLYGVGQLIPGMTEAEARAMLPLGHNFQIPSVYPYGTPAITEPAAATSTRIPIAARTGEPEDTIQGIIVNGPAPQAAWVPPEPEPPAPPPPAPGELVYGAAAQADWSTTTPGMQGQVIAVAHAEGQPAVAPVEMPQPEEVVAVAHTAPETLPDPLVLEEPPQSEEVVAVAVPSPVDPNLEQIAPSPGEPAPIPEPRDLHET